MSTDSGSAKKMRVSIKRKARIYFPHIPRLHRKNYILFTNGVVTYRKTENLFSKVPCRRLGYILIKDIKVSYLSTDDFRTYLKGSTNHSSEPSLPSSQRLTEEYSPSPPSFIPDSPSRYVEPQADVVENSGEAQSSGNNLSPNDSPPYSPEDPLAEVNALVNNQDSSPENPIAEVETLINNQESSPEDPLAEVDALYYNQILAPEQLYTNVNNEATTATHNQNNAPLSGVVRDFELFPDDNNNTEQEAVGVDPNQGLPLFAQLHPGNTEPMVESHERNQEPSQAYPQNGAISEPPRSPLVPILVHGVPIQEPSQHNQQHDQYNQQSSQYDQQPSQYNQQSSQYDQQPLQYSQSYPGNEVNYEPPRSPLVPILVHGVPIQEASQYSQESSQYDPQASQYSQQPSHYGHQPSQYNQAYTGNEMSYEPPRSPLVPILVHGVPIQEPSFQYNQAYPVNETTTSHSVLVPVPVRPEPRHETPPLPSAFRIKAYLESTGISQEFMSGQLNTLTPVGSCIHDQTLDRESVEAYILDIITKIRRRHQKYVLQGNGTPEEKRAMGELLEAYAPESSNLDNSQIELRFNLGLALKGKRLREHDIIFLQGTNTSDNANQTAGQEVGQEVGRMVGRMISPGEVVDAMEVDLITPPIVNHIGFATGIYDPMEVD